MSNTTVKRILLALTALYCLSLATSMAGMELFGFTITALIFGLWAYQHLARRGDPAVVRALGPDWAMLAFFVVVAVGSITTPTLPMKLRIDVVGQMRWMLLLYALTTVAGEFEDLQPRALWILFGAYAIASVYGVTQSLFNFALFGHPYDVPPDTFGGLTVWRARGFFSNTMSFSYCLGQVACFLFGFILIKDWPRRTRMMLWGGLVVLLIGLLFGFTRGAWLGIVFAFVAMGFLLNRRLGLKVTVIVATLLAVGYIVSPAVRNRLASVIHEGEGRTSVSTRYDIWRVNWQMFKDHPWFGIGYGYNDFYAQEYNLKVLGHEGFTGNAHNNLLEVLAGCGIPGLLLWLYICGYFGWRTWRLYWHSPPGSWSKAIALGSLGAQLFFHFGGFTQATFFDAKPTHILLVGWAFVLSRQKGSAL